MIFLLLQAASASEGFCTKSMRDETETSFVKKTSVKKEIITCAVVGAIPAEVVGKKTVKRLEAAHDVRVRVAEKATLVYDAYAFQDKEGEERLEEVERVLSHGVFFEGLGVVNDVYIIIEKLRMTVELLLERFINEKKIIERNKWDIKFRPIEPKSECNRPGVLQSFFEDLFAESLSYISRRETNAILCNLKKIKSLEDEGSLGAKSRPTWQRVCVDQYLSDVADIIEKRPNVFVCDSITACHFALIFAQLKSKNLVKLLQAVPSEFQNKVSYFLINYRKEEHPPRHQAENPRCAWVFGFSNSDFWNMWKLYDTVPLQQGEEDFLRSQLREAGLSEVFQ